MLVTRPEPDASETAALVAARGFVPVVAPVLTIEPRRIEVEGRFDAVVVTSRNAVAALPAAVRAVPLLAVGSATAARAREAGFEVVRDAAGDGAALAALARESLPAAAQVLFVHGEGVGDGLAAALEGAGFRVTRRMGYAVRAVGAFPEAAAAALAAGRVRAATFLSAETARVFVRLVPAALRPALGGVDAVAIGPPAAAALALLPWRRVLVSVRPTLDEVLAQL